MLFRLQIKPGMRRELTKYVEWDAAVARDGGPGTLRYDVCGSAKDENVVFLYEAYESAEAFDFHKQQEPFKAFARIREQCVESMKVLFGGASPLATNVVAKRRSAFLSDRASP